MTGGMPCRRRRRSSGLHRRARCARTRSRRLHHRYRRSRASSRAGARRCGFETLASQRSSGAASVAGGCGAAPCRPTQRRAASRAGGLRQLLCREAGVPPCAPVRRPGRERAMSAPPHLLCGPRQPCLRARPTSATIVFRSGSVGWARRRARPHHRSFSTQVRRRAFAGRAPGGAIEPARRAPAHRARCRLRRNRRSRGRAERTRGCIHTGRRKSSRAEPKPV